MTHTRLVAMTTLQYCSRRREDAISPEGGGREMRGEWMCITVLKLHVEVEGFVESVK